MSELMQPAMGALQSKMKLSQDLDRNHELLRTAADQLCAIRDDNENNAQTSTTKKTTNAYNLWISKVMKIEEYLNSLSGRYPNESAQGKWRVWRRSGFSKEMLEKYEEVCAFIEEGKFPSGFLVEKPPERVITQNAPRIHQFPTLRGPLERILSLLRDDKTEGIGIHGMFGVGKTTIMKNLNNHEEVSKSFDIVIWVKVSKDNSEKKIQAAIARRLKLDMERITDPDDVASAIASALKDKKYLLLLDEVMDELNLRDIGIRIKDNRSKVVLTTEYRHVCYGMVDIFVEVKQLSKAEAWQMFREMVIKVIGYPDVESLARRVAHKCAGLPFLIRTVASSFQMKESASLWRAGLNTLQRWPQEEYQGLKEIYEFLQFCYDELKDDHRKKCFLYGALYPGDTEIYADDLVECWAAEGLLGKIDKGKTYQGLRDEGNSILQHLLSVSLLEGEKMMHVRMNDCIRQVALHISCKDGNSKILVKTNDSLDALPNVEEWQQANWISLIDNNVQILHENPPNCCMLSTLLLKKNLKLTVIPEKFFDHMKNLLVLDLSNTGIVSLPSSLNMLKILRGLYLVDCFSLTELAYEIRLLRQLEVLDIRGSAVKFIPSHIQHLVNLRCFRISFTNFGNQNHIQQVETGENVLSSLSKLEELMIEVGIYGQWCSEVEITIQEVATLTNLNTLRFCFPRSEHLKKFVHSSPSWRNGQLTSFQFFIGCQSFRTSQILDLFDYKISRHMIYCTGERTHDSTIAEVLPETHAFELIGHKHIVKFSDFEIKSMDRLRACLIEACDELITVVDGITGAGAMLPDLEQLYMINLPKLKSISEGTMQHGSFGKLVVLSLQNCPLLTNIFCNGLIYELFEIQTLVVEECHEIEELIVKSRDMEVNSHLLPNLKTLILLQLPNLRKICPTWHLEWPSLETLQIFSCPKLGKLPFREDNATKLRSIEGEQVWWETLKWNNSRIREKLQPICTLK